MPYLNLDLDYFEHPKVKRLVGLLGKGSEVLSIRLWCYCGKYHKEDGRLTGYSTQEIESIAGWWGKPDEMINAMVRIGLLEKDGEDYRIHDWMDHEGHLPALSNRAKNAAKARWAKLGGTEAVINTDTPEAADAPSNATSNASSIAPSNARGMLEQCPIPSIPSKPNQSKPAAAVHNRGTVHVQDPPETEKAPLPPEGIDPLVIPEDQFSARDGTSLKAYLLHTWGADARRLSSSIFTSMLTLGMRFGWEELYRAIDEGAKYDKKNYAYVAAIVDPSQRVANHARKEKSWKEDFVNELNGLK